jgi:hypothetical protein
MDAAYLEEGLIFRNLTRIIETNHIIPQSPDVQSNRLLLQSCETHLFSVNFFQEIIYNSSGHHYPMSWNIQAVQLIFAFIRYYKTLTLPLQ